MRIQFENCVSSAINIKLNIKNKRLLSETSARQIFFENRASNFTLFFFSLVLVPRLRFEFPQRNFLLKISSIVLLLR